MLSDIIKVLFESLRLDDEPVNILVGKQLCEIKSFYYDDRLNEYVLELTNSYKYNKPTQRDDDKRFFYHEGSSEIGDRVTGYTYYYNNKEIVDLLNKLNNRADKNAEKYWNLKIRIEDV